MLICERKIVLETVLEYDYLINPSTETKVPIHKYLKICMANFSVFFHSKRCTSLKCKLLGHPDYRIIRYPALQKRETETERLIFGFPF